MKIIESKQEKGTTHQIWFIQPLGHTQRIAIRKDFLLAKKQITMECGFLSKNGKHPGVISKSKQKSLVVAERMEAKGFQIQVVGKWAFYV